MDDEFDCEKTRAEREESLHLEVDQEVDREEETPEVALVREAGRLRDQRDPILGPSQDQGPETEVIERSREPITKRTVEADQDPRVLSTTSTTRILDLGPRIGPDLEVLLTGRATILDLDLVLDLEMIDLAHGLLIDEDLLPLARMTEEDPDLDLLRTARLTMSRVNLLQLTFLDIGGTRCDSRLTNIIEG